MTPVPVAPTGEWRRTAPLSMLAGPLHNLPSAGLSIVAGLVAMRSIGQPWLLALIVVAVLAITAGCTLLAWRHRRYLIGADDLRIEHGLLSRQVRAIPYDRIHDVALREPLAARLFGLVEVGLDTGTGEKDEAKLAFVTAAEGARLRDTVRALRAGVTVPVTAEAEQAEADGDVRPLFALTPGRLVLLGVFEFSLIVFALLAGAAQQFDFLLDLYDWRAMAEGPLRWLLGVGLAVQVAAAVLGLVLLVPVGLATGIVRTALRDWNFRLDETPRGLRRQRGLLTRSDVVMPVARVQALVLGTGIVRHRWGWHGLKAVSLAQDSKEDKSHTLVPFGQWDEIAPVAALVGLPLPAGDVAWHCASPAWRNRQMVLAAAVPGLVGLALVGVAVATLGELAVLAPLLWLVAAVLAFRQWYLWRHNRHALAGELLWSLEGWLSPRLVVAAPVKLQSAELRQGPLARRGGYADLHLGLAGGTLALHGLPLAQARAMRDAVVARMAAVDFADASLPA